MQLTRRLARAPAAYPDPYFANCKMRASPPACGAPKRRAGAAPARKRQEVVRARPLLHGDEFLDAFSGVHFAGVEIAL